MISRPLSLVLFLAFQALGQAPAPLSIGQVEPLGAAGADVPPGYMILGDGPVPPAGFSLDGSLFAGGGWQLSIAPRPEQQDFPMLEFIRGTILVMGGRNAQATIVGTVARLELASGNWTEGTPMPTPRQWAASTVLGNQAFVIGGVSGEALSSVESYDPVQDAWTTWAPLPRSRFHHAAVSVAGKIYVFGGKSLDGSSPIDTPEVLEFDPVANAWTELGAMPEYSPHGENVLDIAGVFGDRVYAALTAGGFLEYTPSTNTWVDLPNHPIAGEVRAGAVHEGRFFILGPNGQGAVFDPESSRWLDFTAKPGPQSGQGIVSVRWRLVAVNSTGEDPESRSVDEYHPARLLYLHRKN